MRGRLRWIMAGSTQVLMRKKPGQPKLSAGTSSRFSLFGAFGEGVGVTAGGLDHHVECALGLHTS